ncbi:hypothetical protein HOI26_02410 [Candidatus Woesearchaeota archaeon]|jgi:hypothetical protein|nr:hypothetical protein [Candidatus Woesearchaeota archaeon]MBT5739931.1 hypothetical protein [Candidatus Woesearchaeota archaeon]
MKKIITVFIILLFLGSLTVVAEENQQEFTNGDAYDEEFNKIAEEDIYEGVEDIEIEGDAGLTPDSAFYFLDKFIENIRVGDNPEKALEYKEEKLLELKEMIASGNSEAAQEVLERVEKYNIILKKEVSPELDERVRASSKATKVILEKIESELEGDEWEEVIGSIKDNVKEEDKIALAAKISNRIAGLCRALSNLDPLEYSKVCKTDDDAPEWKRDLDRELTEEQAVEAREFFEIMSECFDNPAECRCDDISVKPFAEQCSIIAPLAAACESGDEDACEEMENAGDPIDLLPDYLQDVMEDIEDRYGNSKHDLHVPQECVEAGATSREACMEVMFRLNAPQECQDALESGEINPRNENEARRDCEIIMFNLEAPQECKDAGLEDRPSCERLMFKLDAPQECIDAGLTGSGRDDRKKCDVIRFKLDAPQECLDAGIDGTHRDDWKKCETIKFKLDSPQECLDAGLTGEGRDDWKKCNKITFLLDSPEECHQFADERDPWKACQPVQFKLDAPQECLDAGLDGSGRDDWKKCEKIKFQLEAPEECLAAGLDGSGRNDWRECDKIRVDTKGSEDYGESREDCGSDELHICDDNGYDCRCVSKEEYDKSQGYGDDNNGIDCAVIYCSEGSECIDGVGCVSDGDSDEVQCDDCASQCEDREGQRLKGTDCGPNGCECYYESDEPEYGPGEGPGEPGDYDDNGDAPDDSGSSDSGSDNIAGDATDSGSSDSGSSDNSDSESDSSDSGSSDSSDSDDSGSSDDSSSGGNEITGGVVGEFFSRFFG